MARKTTGGAELPDAPNVLVLETGLVGELLVTTPALRAIKKALPLARVTVVVSPGSAPILVKNPNVDRLLAITKKERGGVLGLMRLASWIRAESFDVAFVFHTSFRSALVAAVGAVPVRAGLACEGRGLLLTHKVPRDRSAYEVLEHLRVVGLLGIPPAGTALELRLTEEEREEAAALVGAADPNRPRVVLHPGASREIRRWPAERFAELGARLLEAAIEPVYAFGPREGGLARAVEAWYERSGLPKPLSVFPRNVRVLGALMEGARAVVTNNTGPMHIAAAVEVPGVFIHGPTPVERWQPPGENHVAVFAGDVECRPCDTSQCSRDSLECMEAVSVDDVHRVLTGLLESAAQTD